MKLRNNQTLWEDYNTPDIYYFIDSDGEILYGVDINSKLEIERKEIGNYFETKEEAEKALEKLKVWKRLRDKGYYFKKWKRNKLHIYIELRVKEYDFLNKDVVKDLDLLFGGEE